MGSDTGLTPRFEERGPLLIAGVSEFYTDATMGGILAQWERFLPHFGQVPGQVGRVAYGLLFPKPEAGGWDYVCGVEVSDGAGLPAGFKAFPIAKTKYAVFEHREYIAALRDTWNYVWSQWLPTSKLKLTSGPRVEWYSETFRPDAPGGVEIWIPLAA